MVQSLVVKSVQHVEQLLRVHRWWVKFFINHIMNAICVRGWYVDECLAQRSRKYVRKLGQVNRDQDYIYCCTLTSRFGISFASVSSSMVPLTLMFVAILNFSLNRTVAAPCITIWVLRSISLRSDDRPKPTSIMSPSINVTLRTKPGLSLFSRSKIYNESKLGVSRLDHDKHSITTIRMQSINQHWHELILAELPSYVLQSLNKTYQVIKEFIEPLLGAFSFLRSYN